MLCALSHDSSFSYNSPRGRVWRAGSSCYSNHFLISYHILTEIKIWTAVTLPLTLPTPSTLLHQLWYCLGTLCLFFPEMSQSKVAPYFVQKRPPLYPYVHVTKNIHTHANTHAHLCTQKSSSVKKTEQWENSRQIFCFHRLYLLW